MKQLKQKEILEVNSVLFYERKTETETDHPEGVRGENVLFRAEDDGVKSHIWREVGPQPFMVTQVIGILVQNVSNTPEGLRSSFTWGIHSLYGLLSVL